MVKKIRFTGNEQEDIRRMLSCKEFVEDLWIIGRMKYPEDFKHSKPAT